MTAVRVAILSVGSELLLGDLVDSNAAWLSQRLTELGVEVPFQVTAGDDRTRLRTALTWLADHADVVVCGGGLGPTHDDLTREAVADAAGVDLVSDPDLEEQVAEVFASRGARMPGQNLRQARIPRGAVAYPPVGTAPAFSVTLPRDCVVYALPGVPWELQELFSAHVQPALLERTGGGATITRTVHVAGMGESSVAEALDEVRSEVEREGTAVLSFLAKQHGIQVRVTVSGADPTVACERSEPVVDRIVGALGPAVAGLDEQSLEQTVVGLLTRAGQTVATAESCTAGDIAARLAQVPGASEVLCGGTVVYATVAKHEVLGVDADLVAAHGPVSREVTTAMARRARELHRSDWGLAVTCVAGPDPQDGQPAGTAWWALADPGGEVEVHGRELPGDRQTVRARVGSAVLELLRRRLVGRED